MTKQLKTKFYSICTHIDDEETKNFHCNKAQVNIIILFSTIHKETKHKQDLSYYQGNIEEDIAFFIKYKRRNCFSHLNSYQRDDLSYEIHMEKETYLICYLKC